MPAILVRYINSDQNGDDEGLMPDSIRDVRIDEQVTPRDLTRAPSFGLGNGLPTPPLGVLVKAGKSHRSSKKAGRRA